MHQQYDFLQVTIEADHSGVEIRQGEHTVRLTRHQMPDLIRTLQGIYDGWEQVAVKQNLERMSEDLRHSPGGRIRAVDANDEPPKGAA